MSQTAAEIRIAKDLADLDGLPDGITINPSDNPLKYTIIVAPQDGPFLDTQINFHLTIPSIYPFQPPRLHCISRIFHPNIDLSGNVCLNILRLDWSPVLSLRVVLLGLWGMLVMPEGEEPLNREAGELLSFDPTSFGKVVQITSRGGKYGNNTYDNIRISQLETLL